MVKKRVKKKHRPTPQHYDPKPTPQKITGAILALIFGNLLFSFSATLSSTRPFSSFIFEPAVVSTSILLAAASYLIISLVKE